MRQVGRDQAGPNIFSTQCRRQRRETVTQASLIREPVEAPSTPSYTASMPVDEDGVIETLTDEQQFEADQQAWIVAHLSKRQKRRARHKRKLRSKKLRSSEAEPNPHCQDAVL